MTSENERNTDNTRYCCYRCVVGTGIAYISLHMCYAENDIENYSFKCAIATTGWRNLVDNDKRFNVD